MATEYKGPPRKLTAAVEERLVQAVRDGNDIGTSAALAGIDRTTLTRWNAMGASGKEPYASLLHRIEIAKAEFIESMVRAVRGAAAGRENVPPDARLALSVLERKRPEQWGRLDRSKVQVEATVKNGAVDYSRLPKEKLKALRELLIEAGANEDEEEGAEPC